MKNIDDFCEKRAISMNMQEAFIAYVRSDYARKYFKSNGESTKLVVGKMTPDEIEEAWQSFVLEMARYIKSKV